MYDRSSIQSKKGIMYSGVPDGRKIKTADNFFAEKYHKLIDIKTIKDKLSVKNSWAINVKLYGSKPSKFVPLINKNKVTTNGVQRYSTIWL
jgi:hypothetical protein